MYRPFSALCVMADSSCSSDRVTTFSTTPLTLLFYPKAYRLQTERDRREKEASGTEENRLSDRSMGSGPGRFSIILEQFDHLPAVFAFCGLLKLGQDKENSALGTEKSTTKTASLASLRLVELTDRTSALVRASLETEQTLLHADTLSSVFRSFAQTLGLPVTSSLAITGHDNYDETVKSHAERERVNCVIVPWGLGLGRLEQPSGDSLIAPSTSSYLPSNPFASLFGVHGPATREGSPQYASFVRQVFAEGQ